MLICQITDLHIQLPGQLCYGVVDTEQALKDCIAAINALPQRPDVVLVTGDLVDFGRPDEYLHLATLLLSIEQPTYLIPGNHDDRDAMRRAFPQHVYLGREGTRANYVLDEYPVRIIAIDTVLEGASGGIFAHDSAVWLDEVLERAPERPTLVMMHHPPFDTGIGHMDEIGLEGSALFRSVISRHEQIERIICGHLHRSISMRFAGTIASTCPSPAHQVELDLDQEAVPRFVMEPPGFQLHLYRQGGGLVTHTAAIGSFAGPYRFDDDGPID